MRFTLITGLIASGLISLTCVAQTPYCNLYWEVNDGSGWTRNQLVTSQRTVMVRYLAEWDAPGSGSGAYLGHVSFDGTISQAAPDDSVSLIARSPSFFQISQGFSPNLNSRRFGDLIKLDSESDVALPGAGAGWVECYQSIDFVPPTVNYSRTLSIFSYTLDLGETLGTRDISSVARVHPTNGSTATIMGPFNTAQYRVFAPSQGVRVTYVPSPAITSLLILGLAIPRRRKT